jgi:hypothetical protein
MAVSPLASRGRVHGGSGFSVAFFSTKKAKKPFTFHMETVK